MEINLKLNKNFVTSLNKMRENYGEEFEKLNGLHEKNLNYGDFIDAFVDSETVADATIDGNANTSTKDICSLLEEMSKPQQKLFAFNKIFYELNKKYGLATARKWLEAEWNGAFYLHDAATSTFKSYCFAYDLEDLVNKGLFFVSNFNSGAPKHLMTYTRDVLEFVSWTSNRTSGACGLPSFLIYSYYFWYNDIKNNYFLKDPDYYRKQSFQEIIYGLNQPYLRVNQSAFTNFSIFDRNYLIELFGGRKFPNGENIIDHIEQIIVHQKVFMEEVSRIRSINMFTFPVISYSLLFQDGEFVDEEFARWCSDHNSKWNDGNFFNGPDITSLSSCCRLINDFSKLDGFINSIGGTALKIGSIKVNTINLMRIAYESQRDEDKYIAILKERTDLCIKTLDIVRGIIVRNIEKGLLPNYTYNLIDITKQYNTIGISAMYEAIDHFGYIKTDDFGNKSYSDKGIIFASRIMKTINEVKENYDFNYSINVEAVPAERAAVILCEKDNLIYTNYNDYFIYSNQWIPLTEKCTIQEKLRLGSILDIECGGGQISHINIDAPLSKIMAWEMLNKIAATGVIYFAFNTKISTCKSNHGFYGEKCPECGGDKVDTYQRIVGFLTPSRAYSKERKREFRDRNWYESKEFMNLKELG